MFNKNNTLNKNKTRQNRLIWRKELGNYKAETNTENLKSSGQLATVISSITNVAQNAPLQFKLNMLQQQFSSQESPEALLECQVVTWAKIKIGFHHTMKRVYRDNYTFDKAESLRQQALDGNFEWLPVVRYVDADSLGGANGAYDADSETLFLNADLAGSELAAPTFLEEAGHHLDTVLNISDAGRNEATINLQETCLEC